MEGYEHIKVIGKGTFGIVSKVRRKSDGKMLVWKEVNYGHMTEKEKQLIVTEVNLLRELRHPYIVQYLDRVIDKSATKIFIVMEWCSGGDLGQYIKQKRREKQYIDEKFIWKVFANIFLALKECHQRREGKVLKPILHRDIKPGNIFLDSKLNAKLGDFGLARELSQETKFAQTNVGTPYYMSPEMVNELHYDERSDIWALGCLLYEMAALAPPFDATNHLVLAKKINAAKFKRIPDHYSENLFQVIRWMLHRLRSRRPRIEDLERLPQFSSYLKDKNSLISEYHLQNNYNIKLKELRAYEESLHRLEASLSIREQKIKNRESELDEREQRLKKREELNLFEAYKKIDKNNSSLGSTSDTSPTYSSSFKSSGNSNSSSEFDRSAESPSTRRNKDNPSKHKLFPRFENLSMNCRSPRIDPVRNIEKISSRSPLPRKGILFSPSKINGYCSPAKSLHSKSYRNDYEVS